MHTCRSLLLVPIAGLLLTTTASGVTTFSPPIRSSQGDNFDCFAENLSANPVQVTAVIQNGLGAVVDSESLSIPAGQALLVASSQTAIFAGYCQFTFDGDPAAVRGFVSLQDAGGSDTRLIYPARALGTGPAAATLLVTPPLRSSDGNVLDCVAENLSAGPVQVINQINNGLGTIVASATLTIPAGQALGLAFTTSPVFSAYCTFQFEAPPDQVRGFATREDFGGSNTRLLVEATPTVSPVITPGCCGDCNGDGHVNVPEIITAVNFALASCPAP